jgi:hypothetical protein
MPSMKMCCLISPTLTWRKSGSSSVIDADLEKIGLKLGHRKKLLKAIATLAEGKPPAPVAASREPVPQAHDPDESLAAWERHPGERKPVTTLFADITGSTALTEKWATG